MAFTKSMIIVIVLMSITLLKAQEIITESDHSFVGKEAASTQASTESSSESSTDPSTGSSSESPTDPSTGSSSESPTDPSSSPSSQSSINPSTESPTVSSSEYLAESSEVIVQNVAEDATQMVVEDNKDEGKDDKDATEKSIDQSTDQPTDKPTDQSIDDSTEVIKNMYEESPSSEVHNTSELSEESNEVEPQEMITSEYSDFDHKQILNGSDFSCYGRSFGQYADVAKDCHVFHLCYPFFNSTSDELLYQRITFLCDDDSVFDQKRFVCVDNSTVEHKCSDSPQLYQSTNEEYLIKVFSQVSPGDEAKDESSEEDSTPSSGWFNWLYQN